MSIVWNFDGSADVTVFCPQCGSEVETSMTDGGFFVSPESCPGECGAWSTADLTAMRDAAALKIDNYDPTPYCHDGHRSAKDCDCGPIARND